MVSLRLPSSVPTDRRETLRYFAGAGRDGQVEDTETTGKRDGTGDKMEGDEVYMCRKTRARMISAPHKHGHRWIETHKWRQIPEERHRTHPYWTGNRRLYDLKYGVRSTSEVLGDCGRNDPCVPDPRVDPCSDPTSPGPPDLLSSLSGTGGTSDPWGRPTLSPPTRLRPFSDEQEEKTH